MFNFRGASHDQTASAIGHNRRSQQGVHFFHCGAWKNISQKPERVLPQAILAGWNENVGRAKTGLRVDLEFLRKKNRVALCASTIYSEVSPRKITGSP